MTQSRLREKVSFHRSKYRILGKIGQGQFGQVYCAVHRETGVMVALKDLTQQGFATNQFLREFSYLLSLRHPNIVSCQGVEYHPRGRYLVMDYCAGGTFRTLIEAEARLNLIQGLKLIADILAGLEHAHQCQLVHCDIKPENILLDINTTGWTAKISDFGIARLYQEITSLEKEGGYTGSPAYMAPERFYGKYSYASDIYAVGIILYELVVGNRPFSGSPSELLFAHVNQRLVLPKTIPFILRLTIIKALEKLPQRRFSSAGEMLKAVKLGAQFLATEEATTSFLLFSDSKNYPEYSFNNNEDNREDSEDKKTLDNWEIVQQETLRMPITHLKVDGEYLYRGMVNKVCCQVYGDQKFQEKPLKSWQINLNVPITKLHLSPQGCLVIAHSASQYLFYILPKNYPNNPSEIRPNFSLESQKIVTTIEKKGNWISLASQPQLTSPVATFEILKLPDFQRIKMPINSPLPAQLIALDSCHGLAIFSLKSNQNKQTVFKLFNRRGKLIKGFSLPLSLQILTQSATHPYRLFAIESRNPNLGVLIDLKPLRVTRIFLEINPAFIVAQKWGYILADILGNIVLLNPEGEKIGGLKVANSITAIAGFGNSGILVATWLDKQGILYTIGLTH